MCMHVCKFPGDLCGRLDAKPNVQTDMGSYVRMNAWPSKSDLRLYWSVRPRSLMSACLFRLWLMCFGHTLQKTSTWMQTFTKKKIMVFL